MAKLRTVDTHLVANAASSDRLLPDFYRVLGIDGDAPGEVVERAYWQFVNDWRVEGASSKHSAATLEDANEAYRVLVSPDLRGEYDAMLANGEIAAGPKEEGAASEPPLKVLSKLHPAGPAAKTNGRSGRRPFRNISILRLLTPNYLKLNLLLFGALSLSYVVVSSRMLLSPTNEALVFAGAVLAVLLLLGLAREVERRRLQSSLARSQERISTLFEHSNDAIWSLDLDGRFTAINPAGLKMLGYSSEELLDMSIGEIVQGTHLDTVGELMERGAAGEASTDVNLELFTRTGQSVAAGLTANPLREKGKLTGMLCFVRDESGRKRFQQELTHLASRDSLTGLFNRRRFEEELNLEIGRSRRGEYSSAVLFLDLDHFKDVNDVLGHAAGDELLTRFSELLLSQVRETDVVARLGGDEFTVILPHTDIEGAREFGEKPLDAIGRQELNVNGQAMPMTASIGIARIPDDGRTQEELLASADMAMYQAKEAGRNRVCDYGGELDLHGLVEKRLEWRRRIAEAVAHDLLILHAQPILDLNNGGISNYELLLRMPSADGGVYEAAQFINHAERFGMMRPIDRWVVRNGIRLADRYGGGKHRDVVFEINISAHGFNDDQLPKIIANELAAARIDPKRIVFEVTESAAISNLERANRFISDVKRIGCRFALDDFGVGFSSLHQLKNLDVDYLKIDGAFIRNLPHDTVDQHLVKAIVEVSRALGKATIAEFVGDGQTLNLLRKFGVDFAQGYHIGQPADITTFLAQEVA